VPSLRHLDEVLAAVHAVRIIFSHDGNSFLLVKRIPTDLLGHKSVRQQPSVQCAVYLGNQPELVIAVIWNARAQRRVMPEANAVPP